MAPARSLDVTELPPGQKPPSEIDPALLPFLAPDFDPVDFLNNALPSLTVASTQPHASRQPRSVPLQELSTQTQPLLSQLNAQSVRLSNTLTQLTDGILRSGGRLAYEVEVLRGETIGLSEALTDVLQDDIARFVPQRSLKSSVGEESGSSRHVPSDRQRSASNVARQEDDRNGGDINTDPPFIRQLRMLSQVKSRLEEVIITFGEAMEWPLPPSEVSLTSSLISVSAPEAGSESHSREEKGREVAKKLRNEVMNLLDSNGGGEAGVEAAAQRVESLRTLAQVWRGTAEEKARNKFIDSLAKLVDERRRIVESQAGEQGRKSAEQSPRRTGSKKGRPSMEQIREERPSNEGGGGLFRNLQRLRDEIYLE